MRLTRRGDELLPGLTPALLGLLAAFVVCVAPGYFWARALWPATDAVETLGFSIAFSIALTPAVALIPASVLGLGVTPAVAVLSVAAVFVTGLAAHLWLAPPEPAKDPDEPVFEMPGLMGPRALAWLCGALAFALAAAFGVLPAEWAALGAAPPAVLTGLAWLREPAYETGPSSMRFGGTAAVRWVLLATVSVLVLLRGYLGPVLQDWPYLRGDDQYEHSVMTGMMLSEGSNESFMLYPPGLHLLTAEVSRLSGLEPLEIFPVVAPAFLLLPAIGCYVLAKRLWGWEVGVAAALFGGLLLGGTYYYIEHARYPNLISAQFLMLLALAALIRLWGTPTPRNAIPFVLIGSSVVLYHQVASLYLALLLAFVAAFPLRHLLLRDRRRGVPLFISFAVLGALSLAYAWDTYDLGGLISGLFSGGGETGAGSEAVAQALGTKATPTMEYLLEMVTQPMLWLGLVGSAALLSGWRVRGEMGRAGRLARMLLLTWVLLMFAASRTSWSAFPDRFTRDLGVPLALLAALTVVVVLRSFMAHGGGPRKMLAASSAVFLAAVLIGVQAGQSLQYAAAPNPQLTMTPPVAAAGAWLEDHNTGGNIIATPYLDSLPSRGMLAMGGYTGMQSYTEDRIEWSRDLPPSGAKPLRDALHTLRNPGSERASLTLEKHDVRYVVLEKGYSTMWWRRFLHQPDLYRKAFENGEIVIFAVREG